VGSIARSFGWAKERRRRARYPVALDRTFTLKHRGKTLRCGAGRTVDISSGGVAFRAEGPIRKGAALDLAIAWPALRDDVFPIELKVLGRLLRRRDGIAVSEVRRYAEGLAVVGHAVSPLQSRFLLTS
jgi:hypothetical protein